MISVWLKNNISTKFLTNVIRTRDVNFFSINKKNCSQHKTYNYTPLQSLRSIKKCNLDCSPSSYLSLPELMNNFSHLISPLRIISAIPFKDNIIYRKASRSETLNNSGDLNYKSENITDIKGQMLKDSNTDLDKCYEEYLLDSTFLFYINYIRFLKTWSPVFSNHINDLLFLNGNYSTDCTFEKEIVMEEINILAQISNINHPTINVFNTILYFRSLKNQAKNCQIIFDLIIEHDLTPNETSYSLLMNAYANQHNLDKVISLFNLMKEKHLNIKLLPFAILIKAYILKGQIDEAFEIIKDMKKNNIEPSSIMMNLLIDSCIHNDQIPRAYQIYNEMKLKKGLINKVTYKILIGAFIKNLETDKLMELLEDIPEQEFNSDMVYDRELFGNVRFLREGSLIKKIEIIFKATISNKKLITLNILLYLALRDNKLPEARYILSKILYINDLFKVVYHSYINLFLAYSNTINISNFENNFPKYQINSNNSITITYIINLLKQPAPKCQKEIVKEAQILWNYIDTNFKKENCTHFYKVLNSYLNVHINCGNFNEAIQLYEKYYLRPTIEPHFNLYTKLLAMCLRLNKHEYFKLIWSKVEEKLKPLNCKSPLSQVDKDYYKRQQGLNNSILKGFYLNIINLAVRSNDFELAFQLLEDSSCDYHLRKLLFQHQFKYFESRVQETGHHQLIAKFKKIMLN